MGEQGPASLAWERRMRGERAPIPGITRPAPDYRATILATMAKPDLVGKWVTSSEVIRRAMSTLRKPDRAGSHAPLRHALDALAAEPASPVQLEPKPRGDGRTARRYRRT